MTEGILELLPVPAAVAALLTILSYVVGVIRPVSVKAFYWNDAGVELRCYVKNRRWRGSRMLTSIGFESVPPRRRRWPGWRKRQGDLEHHPLIPVGVDIQKLRDGDGKKIDPRDQVKVICRVLHSDHKQLASGSVLPPDLRVQARFGMSRPALARPRLRSGS